METRNPNTYLTFSRTDPGGKRTNHVESANRKLIRPSLTEYKEQQEHRQQQVAQHAAQQAAQQAAPPAAAGAVVHRGKPPLMKRPVPPDQTNAENFYYVKQMQARTPMVVVLHDGEELHGVIEWYDRGCLKVNRAAGPNLLVYKSNIKYLYKESDKNGGDGDA